jgi:CDP-glycerol glycerophosphotransferase
LSKAFLVPIKNIIKSGYPRNDIFFKQEKEDIILSWDHKFNNPKKIIYLPTFRSTTENTDFFNEYSYDELKLIEVLEKHNAIFITKGHFCDNQISSSTKSDRIINLSDSDLKEINPILKHFDVMLTDYSGVYFDFLLTLKPIIFTAFDLDAYKQTTGINFDYNALVSGPIAKDWNDVIIHLQKSLVDHEYLTITKDKNDFFNSYRDENSSSKLFSEIIKRIK